MHRVRIGSLVSRMPSLISLGKSKGMISTTRGFLAADSAKHTFDGRELRTRSRPYSHCCRPEEIRAS